MTRCALCTAATKVAKLVFAKEACHVVAPFCSLDLSPAHWTKDNCVNTLIPAIKGPFHGLFTGGAVAVPIFSAPEAYSMSALGTL